MQYHYKCLIFKYAKFNLPFIFSSGTKPAFYSLVTTDLFTKKKKLHLWFSRTTFRVKEQSQKNHSSRRISSPFILTVELISLTRISLNKLFGNYRTHKAWLPVSLYSFVLYKPHSPEQVWPSKCYVTYFLGRRQAMLNPTSTYT